MLETTLNCHATAVERVKYSLAWLARGHAWQFPGVSTDMKLQQFLAHYGVKENPFGQEDAQSDQVFKEHCLESAHHPAWDKVYGSPFDPSTSVVFGQKGSGKTALRLQIVDHLRTHNLAHPDERVFVIEYDDFNPFLDCFQERLSARHRKPDKALAHWRLWDHMDAILTLGVTRLVDTILADGSAQENRAFGVKREQVKQLSHLQSRDLLLLASFYDHSLGLGPKQRWMQLRKKVGFSTWYAGLDWAAGLGITAMVLILWMLVKFDTLKERLSVLLAWWLWTILIVAWGPWLWRQARLMWTAWNIKEQVRVIDHQSNTLRDVLSRFQRAELAGQPIPSRERSDDRYELLNKFYAILAALGFKGVMVLVDRVDEPHLINGNAERMKDLLWPMFDNKFLKQPGVGFKLLLPSDVNHYLQRENREFYERSRLDKQNLVPSLEWTGESLYDVANARIRACADEENGTVGLRQFFDESIPDGELVATLSRLRVPRHLFKFLYRLLVNHCNKYTDDNPRWKIDRENLHSTMALYQRDLDAFDRGLGTG